eukprot:2794333-Amphidinium_carterae.1
MSFPFPTYGWKNILPCLLAIDPDGASRYYTYLRVRFWLLCCVAVATLQRYCQTQRHAKGRALHRWCCLRIKTAEHPAA